MKKILVPFDFSDYSLSALLTAKKILSKISAQLVCVTVIPSEIDWDVLPEKARESYPELVEEWEEAVSRIPSYLKKIFPSSYQVDLEVKIGVPAEQILRLAEQKKVDLIVLGAYGKDFKEGKFIGSTLQKVLRGSPCPVLAVKKPLDGNAFRKIAFASLFEPSSLPAFSALIPWVKNFTPILHLVYVNTPSHFENTTQTEEAMRNYSKSHKELSYRFHTINASSVVEGLANFSDYKSIGIIALVSSSKKGKPSYLIGTTETLIYTTDKAVLSMPWV